MDVVPGMKIGDDYAIVDRIAYGRLGTVYKASQSSVGHPVAVRILSPVFTTQQGFHERFQREAKAFASLRHRNVVPVLDYGEQDGIAYLVMELIEGDTLANVRGKSLGAMEVVTILEPVASALDYVHARGVMHGDIKPSNILLAGNGRPMLADAGLLGLVTEGKPMAGLRDASGVLIGTPAYAAPELAKGSPLTAATDLYALAVVAYELLTGRVPYAVDTPAAVIGAHEHQPLPPPRTINPQLPAALDEVLLRALAKDPSERYATASELVTALASGARQEDDGAQRARAPMLSATAVIPEATASTAAPQGPMAASSAAAAPDAGAGVTGSMTAQSPGSPVPGHGKPAFGPLVLAGLGGAVLVLIIGVVALTRQGGSNNSLKHVAASTVAAPIATAAISSRATVLATPAVKEVVKTPIPVAASLRRAGVWRKGQAMRTARSVVRAVVLHDGRVLVMGGLGTNGPLADVELFNPVTGRWAITGSMHVARDYFTATVLLDGQVLVAGGTDSESYLADAEIYDPKTGAWTVTGSMHTPRDEHVAVLLPNGAVLVAGGETTGTTPMSMAEIYDPRTGAWSAAPPMSTPRWDATATLLADGTVLVAGGGSASTEIYNPTTNRWKTTGSMSTVRYRHTATLLPDHTVLVAGGETAFTSLLNTAEIYNPRTGAWTSAGTMPHPHSRHTASLLPDGEVMVAGGSTGKDPQVSVESGTSSVDIYDPTNHRWFIGRSMRSNRAEQGAALVGRGRVLQIGGYTYQGSVTATTDLYSAPAGR